MTRTRTFVTTAAALALATVAGFAAARAAHAEDPPAPTQQQDVRAQVERLLPDLWSDDAATRERAEKAIVALGEPARAELDRLTRDPDSQRAIAALKLLQHGKWPEDRASKDTGGADARLRGYRHRFDMPDFEKEIERWSRDMDKRMDEFRRRIDDWRSGFDIQQWVPFTKGEDGANTVTESRGVTEQDGRRLEWSVERDGRIKVKTRDGEGAAETTVEAPNLETLRKEHPDLAARVEPLLPRAGGRGWTFVWPPQGGLPWSGGTRTPDRGPLSGSGAEEPAARDGDETIRLHELFGAPTGPMLGIGAGPVPEVLRDQLDLPEGGIVVESVVRDSLAERLGLRRNDIVLKVGDRAVSASPDVRKALEAIPEKGEVRVEVLRKGRRETFTATR